MLTIDRFFFFHSESIRLSTLYPVLRGSGAKAGTFQGRYIVKYSDKHNLEKDVTVEKVEERALELEEVLTTKRLAMISE